MPATTSPDSFGGRRLVLVTVLLGGFTAFGPLSMDLYLPASRSWPGGWTRARPRSSSR